MILDTTGKKIEVVLAGAPASAQLAWQSAYADHTSASFTPGSTDGLTSGTTAVTLVSPPLTGAQRQVKLIAVYNADTAAAIVTVRLNSSAAVRILVRVTLAVGDTLEWTSDSGWKVITSSGTVKTGISPAGASGEYQYNSGGSSLGATPNLARSSLDSILVGIAGPAVGITDGFPYVSAMSGAPTGTPTAQAGRVATVYDITNDVLWVYDGGWKRVGPFLWAGGSGSANLVAGNFYAVSEVNETSATEVDTEVLLASALRLYVLRVRLTVAPGAGTSRTFTIRVNGANTAATVTIADSATTGVFTGNVAAAAGDRITMQHTVSGAPATSLAQWGVEMQA